MDFYLKILEGSPCGVLANMLDWDFLASKYFTQIKLWGSIFTNSLGEKLCRQVIVFVQLLLF